MPEPEVSLTGGNVTSGVVRVGETVRRPAGPHTPAVHALLTHLAEVGFDVLPERSASTNRDGRSGTVVHPHHNDVVASDRALSEVVRRIRDLHTASAGFTPPPDARWQRPSDHVGDELVAHNDLGRWNIVHPGAR